jgi:hypothetical protein
MKTALYLALTILIIISGCKKDEDIETINFGGITETDYAGNIISEDPTDWQFNDTWSNKEKSLFDAPFLTSCETLDPSFYFYAYPNPCNDVVTLSSFGSVEYNISYRIVDKNYNIIFSSDEFNSFVHIDLNSYGVSNETVRVYYRLQFDECELQGHGDIRIE